MTPEQEASYALKWDLQRDDLPVAAQLEYDRLKPAWEKARAAGPQALIERVPAPVWGHTVDRTGSTHTFRSMPGFHVVTGILAVIIGIGTLVGDAAALAYPSSSWARGSGGVSGWGDFWMAVGGLFLIWVGIRLTRVGVRVSARKLTNRGYFRTRTVDAAEIRAITLQPKNDGNGARWIARVELTGGKGFWIQSFDCGPAWKPPIPHRAAALDEARAVLGIAADDIGQPEIRQGA